VIERAADGFRLVINPVIYAEGSIRYSRIEELDAALPKTMFDREAIPPFRSTGDREVIPACQTLVTNGSLNGICEPWVSGEDQHGHV
jgi:hypothetical protein